MDWVPMIWTGSTVPTSSSDHSSLVPAGRAIFRRGYYLLSCIQLWIYGVGKTDVRDAPPSAFVDHGDLIPPVRRSKKISEQTPGPARFKRGVLSWRAETHVRRLLNQARIGGSRVIHFNLAEEARL